MKKLLFLILFIISNKNFAQKNNWKKFSEEKITKVNINKTGIYKVQNYILNVVWNEKLSYSENIGYYGGIQKLSIYKKNKKLQVINKIEDGIALGNINFSFYDYNFDGYIDLSIPIDSGNSCWDKYYIFNPKSNKFENKKSWDYLRIQKIDKKNKLILSQPSGNAFEDNRKTYKIKGLKIIEIGEK
ncbi:XAC2610-related protein [Tenacibaculum dicentrarchi]|uniref:XAC2610-related protein n=1 Tax=Tenacibaculum dicentrarchi TaxID=669041 RepID=UPI0035172011